MCVNWIERARALQPVVRDFVGGRRRSESHGKPIEKYAPRDGRFIYNFAGPSEPEVHEVVIVARDAFADGRWSSLQPAKRKDALLKLATLMEEHAEHLALLESVDVGKPINDALNYDVPLAAQILRFNAECADKHYGPVYGADPSSVSFELNHPVGVVAAIVGWNFPLFLAAQKIGPALITGNSLVLKPSEMTSLSAAYLAELAIEAGVPEGVFNVIHGGPDVGAVLARHPDIDLISFTGSTRTGKSLMVAAGESNMKRLLLECGGKAPNIVFEDSPNLDAVATAITNSAFRNQGEVCVASSRLLVHESIKDQLLEILIAKVSRIVVGDPLLSDTGFGAVVSRAHQQKILDYLRKGISEGARLAFQSSAAPPHADGFYVPPVVFSDVSPTQRIAQEEIFGPVLAVISFRDELDAIRIANNTIFGLSATLWTRDLGRAHRVSHSINAGWVVVNATDRPHGGPGLGVMSVGGHKQSGIGSEGGLRGLEEYTNRTAVQYFV